MAVKSQRRSMSVMNPLTMAHVTTSNQVPWWRNWQWWSPRTLQSVVRRVVELRNFAHDESGCPIPRIKPYGVGQTEGRFPQPRCWWLQLGGGEATRNPFPHVSPVTSSPLMIWHPWPASSQSSATPNAAVADAQARLMVVLGPRIPVYCAN